MATNNSQVSLNDSILADDDDDDYNPRSSIVPSQTIRPQRFYQDLDHALDNQPKDVYITDLIRLCRNDPDLINDYRERLAERAKRLHSCPQTKLLNRRNSPNSSKAQKLAIDCYVLYMFINGNNTREIQDVFVNTGTSNNDIAANITITVDDPQQEPQTPARSKCTSKLELPDVTTMLLNIQSDLAALSNVAKHNNAILLDISSDMKTVACNTRLTLAAVNGLRSRSDDNTHIEQLQNDIKQISSNIGRINKKVDDAVVKSNTLIENKSSALDNTRSFAQVVIDTPHVEQQKGKVAPKTKQNLSKSNETETSTATINVKTDEDKDKNSSDRDEDSIHIEIRPNKVTKQSTSGNQHATKSTDKPKHSNFAKNVDRDPRKPAGDKFTAVKKRNITSFYVGNIDPDAYEKDIVQYLTDNEVRCTFIRMFRGKYGSAAKVNIPDDYLHIVENDQFWPSEIVIRKWKDKSDWDQTQSERQYSKNDRNNRYRGNRRYNHGYNRNRGYTHNSKTYDYDHDTYYDKSGNDHHDDKPTNSDWSETKDDWNDDAENWGNPFP